MQDYVSDVDDVLKVTEFTVDANGDDTPETYTFDGSYSGESIELTDEDGSLRGTLTIEDNGNYTFTPAENYAGDVPPITYTMTEDKTDGSSVTQTLTFEITKISDAPGLEAKKTVNTNEDTFVSLGLKAPVITDTGTGTVNDDHPERLGEITLTIGGDGATGVTLSTGSQVLKPVDGKITIVITDEPHVTDVPTGDNDNGIYHLTQAEYEALVANPPAESGKNFTVTVEATSYEVDASGVKIPGVVGASNTQVIDVDVQAVTDGATLATIETKLTVAEDGTIDLSTSLRPTLTSADVNAGNDTDGSETYWYTITGLPIGTVVTIDGVSTTISADNPTVISSVSDSAAPPSIFVTPPANYSGNIDDITITLNSQDTDTDSAGTIDIITSSVKLDLLVTPVADDVSVNDVTTLEDTAVAFLAGGYASLAGA